MSETFPSIDQSLCPLCGKANRCAMEIEKETGEKQAACWCSITTTRLLFHLPMVRDS